VPTLEPWCRGTFFPSFRFPVLACVSWKKIKKEVKKSTMILRWLPTTHATPRFFPAFCSIGRESEFVSHAFSPRFAPAPIVFPCSRAKKRVSWYNKKKRESLKKEKKKNKRTGHGRNTQIGSVATPAKTVWATVCPVHPRVHPSFLFFSLPFLLFHSFLFLAPVISNIWSCLAL
jgi:hypothetical protein